MNKKQTESYLLRFEREVTYVEGCEVLVTAESLEEARAKVKPGDLHTIMHSEPTPDVLVWQNFDLIDEVCSTSPNLEEVFHVERTGELDGVTLGNHRRVWRRS